MKLYPLLKPLALHKTIVFVVKSTFIIISCFCGSFSSQAANRYWIAPLPSNWSNTSNWSASSGGSGGASVPGALDIVTFDNAGMGNCTMDVAVSITNLLVSSGYTGTLIQGASTISIAGTATLIGGIFNGGTAGITITGAFSLSGTAFTSTTGILELRDNAAFTSGSFAHNNGTVRFNTLNNTAQTTTGISPTFYVLEFVGLGRPYTLSSAGIITVISDLNFTGSSFYTVNTGIIHVKGNIIVSNTAYNCSGNAEIIINGTVDQNFVGAVTAFQGALPKVVINKSSGDLNLSNFPAASNDFTYIAGTVNTSGYTFCFTRGGIITGNIILDNIAFDVTSSGGIFTIATGTTITATEDVTISGFGNLQLNSGNIDVYGNLLLVNTAYGSGGSATINIIGASNQMIDGTAIVAGQSRLPNIIINKPGGTLTFSGNISFFGNVTYTAGLIDPGTSTVHIVRTLTITGSFTLYNLSINTSGTIALTIASGNTITVANDYTMETGTANQIIINTGTIAVQGNIINNNTGVAGGGSGTLLINGTGNQNITSTGVIFQGTLPRVTIDKASGTLTLPSLITVKNNWTYIAGTIDATTNNSTVVFGFTLTVSGNHTLRNVVFDGGGSYAYTIAAGTTLNLTGNMAISGSGNVLLNTGAINLEGNLNLTNTATGGGGNAVINVTGTANQAITGSLSSYQSSLPSIVINKNSGMLTLPSTITVKGNYTYTTGSLDVSTNNSNIVFGNSMTISGTHSLNNITFDGAAGYTYTLTGATTLNITGNMTMSGTGNIFLNNGTINLNGDLILTNTATSGSGSTLIAFVAPINQQIISSLLINQCNLPAVTINKPSGTLTFPAIITVRGNWTFLSGTLDLSTNNATVVYNGSLSLSGSHTLNHVNFEGTISNTYTVLSGTILTVSGTLITSGNSAVTINTPISASTAIQAQGDILITNTSTSGGGTGTILINGTGAQTLDGTSPSGQGRMAHIRIQKASGILTLNGIISESRDWTYISGTVDPASSTVVFGRNNLAISSSGMNFNNVSVISNTISLSNSIVINGNLTISSGAFAAGSNSIALMGNWINHSSIGFSESTSTVEFKGTSLQTITVPGGEVFASLILNNTGAGIQLVNNVTTSSTLVMTQGNVDLNNSILTLGTSVANRGTLSRSNGTIINTGSFVRWFNTTNIPAGSSNGLFPMGTLTDYQPLFVSAPSTAPTTGGTITIAYNNAAGNTAVSFPDGAANLEVRKNLNWAISTANGLAGGTYELSARGTGFGVVADIADLRLTLAANIIGTAGTNGGTITNPQVNRIALSAANLSNSYFIGSVNASSTTLPVRLLFFNATLKSGRAKLNWATASETNNAFFTIQRCIDGLSWFDLFSVKSAGNGNSNTFYEAFDERPLKGKAYYRLKQTDMDGASSNSAIRELVFLTEDKLKIYPNPFTDYIVIEWQGQQKPVINLYNGNGEQLYPKIIDENGRSTIFCSLLSKGFYFIRTGHENVNRTNTFIKN